MLTGRRYDDETGNYYYTARYYDPPAVLYIKGSLRACDNLAIAIVGTRRCSLYG